MYENFLDEPATSGFEESSPDSPPITIWGVWLKTRRFPEGRWVCNTGSTDGRVFFPDREEAEKEAEEMQANMAEGERATVVQLWLTEA